MQRRWWRRTSLHLPRRPRAIVPGKFNQPGKVVIGVFPAPADRPAPKNANLSSGIRSVSYSSRSTLACSRGKLLARQSALRQICFFSLSLSLFLVIIERGTASLGAKGRRRMKKERRKKHEIYGPAERRRLPPGGGLEARANRRESNERESLEIANGKWRVGNNTRVQSLQIAKVNVNI